VFFTLGGNAMKLPRRKFLHLAAGAAALPAVSRIARAQAYPSRPVRIIVGFPAGGLGDMGARLIAQALSERMGQSFIVENRPGAASNLATEAVIRSPADGYTLLALAASASVNQSVYDKLSFNLLTDVAMVAGTVTSPLILVVHPSVPVNTVPEMIAYAKTNAAKITLASYGTATTSHVAGELFKMMTDVNMVHVPYRGSAPMVIDLIAGQVHSAMDTVTSSLGHIRAGKLRPIAVCSVKRSALLPNIPSMSEFLPGFEANGWNGIAAPKGTAAAIVNQLNSEINTALADPALVARITQVGAEVFRTSPAELASMVAAEVSRWSRVVKFANIKPE
jgi:tripartite-type tricarboxylate transporter receptor subunit TctC